jgi:hypothetical protein
VEVRLRMDFTTLLKMLLELEQAIGTESDLAIRMRVQDIESQILETQKERVERVRSLDRRNFAA